MARTHAGVIGLALVGITGGAAHAGTVDLFLFAGQSNMVGGASVAGLPMNVLPPRHDVQYSWRLHTGQGVNESDGFGPLQHLGGMGLGTTFGPELSFGHRVADALPDRDFAIAKFAVNGSSLDSRWGPDDNILFPEFMDYAQRQIAALEDAGHTVNLAGLVWVQGSGDAYEFRAQNYAANMHAFVDALRDGLGSDDLPVLLTQEHADSGRPAVDLLRLQKQAFADADPYAWLVNIDDGDLRDDVHFTPETTLLAGDRLADAWLAIPTPGSGAILLVGSIVAARRRRNG
jgi:hypothetical protein